MATLIDCDPAHNAELKLLRAKLHLGRKRIAEIARVSKSLVDSWLVGETSQYFRPMPSKALRLIKLELGLERPEFRHVKAAAEKRTAEIRGL